MNYLTDRRSGEKLINITTLDFPALAAETKDGTNNRSPGPKILLGRMQQVKSPLTPFDLITNASPSAFVAEYESLC